MDSKIIRFDRIGITEIDVENCDSRIILLEWKNEVEKDLVSLRERIEYIKKAEEKTDETYERLKRTNYLAKRLSVFAQKIALRLSQLKTEKIPNPVLSVEEYEKRAKIKEESRTSFPWFFLEVAKEVLTMKQFTEIEEEAYIRKKRAHEERIRNRQNEG